MLASFSDEEQRKILEGVSDDDIEKLLFDWKFWGRKNQFIPPGLDWTTWLLLAGRGFGKTRTGAETVREWVESSDKPIRVALVGATAGDTRDVMVEGESGILAISPPWFYPRYQPSKRRLIWPNGSIATLYSADEPARLRGPQHHKAWADEAAVWKYIEAWDNLMFGLRLGNHPQTVVTTTPKRVKLIKDLLIDSTTIVTKGRTYDNLANLATNFINTIIKKYEGTSVGRQELDAELLEDAEGSFWKRKQIEDLRISYKKCPKLKRIVVGVDPSGSNLESAAECGIVVAGLGHDGNGYVLDDLSLRASPNKWAKVAVDAFHRRKADRIVAEVNYGGQMVEAVIRTVDSTVSYRAVSATRGKEVRAEPVASLYEQNRVHHVGTFALMEDEMCTWVPGTKSPNRMDALVWALTDLMLKNSGGSSALL